MEIGYFREFVILAETQNFWEAAERLFMNESTLSKHIKSMENQLGEPLFKRTSRKVELTEFGEKMLPYAQQIARIQYEYDTTAFNYIHQENTTLEFATIPAIAHYNITDVLLKFREDYPNVQVNIQEADTLIIREMLLNCQCELAFYRDSVAYMPHDPDKESQLAKIPYMKDPLMAVLPTDHPLAGRKSVELKDLADEKFALIHADTLPYELCVSVCREAGFTPDVVFTSHNIEAILDMVRKGGCVALLFSGHVNFPHNIEFDQNPPFVALPITPEISTTVSLAYRKNDTLSPAARHFIEYYKTNCSNLLNNTNK